MGPESKTPGGEAGRMIVSEAKILLNLALFELDMLAHDGVIFIHHQLFSLGACVLLRHVEEAGIRSGVHADLD